MSFLKHGSPEKVIGLVQKKGDSKKKKASKVEDEEEVVKGKKKSKLQMGRV